MNRSDSGNMMPRLCLNATPRIIPNNATALRASSQLPNVGLSALDGKKYGRTSTINIVTLIKKPSTENACTARPYSKARKNNTRQVSTAKPLPRINPSLLFAMCFIFVSCVYFMFQMRKPTREQGRNIRRSHYARAYAWASAASTTYFLVPGLLNC